MILDILSQLALFYFTIPKCFVIYKTTAKPYFVSNKQYCVKILTEIMSHCWSDLAFEYIYFFNDKIGPSIRRRYFVDITTVRYCVTCVHSNLYCRLKYIVQLLYRLYTAAETCWCFWRTKNGDEGEEEYYDGAVCFWGKNGWPLDGARCILIPGVL